ncbi:cupin domain-containing protein [Rhodococcus sp. NPDC057529]|uniref:cupin domain-containing protein n=1 Tax=Rhodococcus sp. NPDC057529 TaxID=3346158 RepID=UPI00366E97D3
MSDFSVRRIVTSHDGNGQAVVRTDDQLPSQELSPTAQSVLLWSTDVFPSDNNDETDGAKPGVGLVSPGGTVFMITNMAPHSESPAHRTVSLDYGIVLDGEIDLVLDDGSTTRVRRGEVVVQRGTIHGWNNPLDVPCVMAFVLVDANPVKVGDTELGEQF